MGSRNVGRLRFQRRNAVLEGEKASMIKAKRTRETTRMPSKPL
jgi:hypothetical protein